MIITRKAAVLAGCCILLMTARLQAQQAASFNFSDASRPVSGWINVHGDPYDNVVTVSDPVSGITISSVSTANWIPYGGACAKDDNGVPGSTFFSPSEVMLNRWYSYGVPAHYDPGTPQLLISGLNKDSLYTLRMSSNSASALDADPTNYTVTGRNVYGPYSVNIHNNTDSGATFINVYPDNNGQVKVYVNTVADGSIHSDVADISALQITQQSGPAGAPPDISITSPVYGSIRPEDGDVVFNVSLTNPGVGIAKVEYFLDSILLGTATTAPFSWTWEHVDVGEYTISAKVTDSVGRTKTNSVSFTVESLNYFWSTTGNIATNADTFFLGTVDTNRLAIRTNNQERMSIMSDGTVGIGTKNTQGYKLAVNGSAIFTKVRIRNYASWPDYVFKKDYELTGLDSLERYIEVNQHLPGIIPADKARKEGIDLADDQALLLKKIEELTLYLIREHKRVEQLTKEVQELKAQAKQKPTTGNRSK